MKGFGGFLLTFVKIQEFGYWKVPISSFLRIKSSGVSICFKGFAGVFLIDSIWELRVAGSLHWSIGLEAYQMKWILMELGRV